MKIWKSLADVKGKPVSNYDKSGWVVGEWRTAYKPVSECVGLNGSKNIIDAMGYVNCEWLALCECGGKIIKGSDKWTCEKMRIIKLWKWEKDDSVRLAIYAAESVLSIFEKECPGDKRPRQAIEAAKAWIKNPCEKTWAASAASAASAAWAAASATWAAARDVESSAAIKNKCHKYVLSLLKSKEA